jgi:hypothetical protein
MIGTVDHVGCKSSGLDKGLLRSSSNACSMEKHVSLACIDMKVSVFDPLPSYISIAGVFGSRHANGT